MLGFILNGAGRAGELQATISQLLSGLLMAAFLDISLLILTVYILMAMLT
jgi:hypothetical protein